MTDEGADGPTELDGTVSWRELLAETAGRLEGVVEQPALEARWICEEASGIEASAWLLEQGTLATVRGVAHLDDMVARRLAGEPVQYVLGHWPFRSLDLLVDRRVLIPRPETEQVVELALAELDRVAMSRPAGHHLTAVDLGTGSGAIALSLAVERPALDVWAVDGSADALAVARANLAALGRGGTNVRMAQGDWWSAVPDELMGQLDLVVANPPYIAEDEELDPSVASWEPHSALVPGPTGLEDLEVILTGAASWLAPGGVVVVEIGAGQGPAVAALAADAGLADVAVHQDYAGLDRAVAGRRPSPAYDREP